MASEYLKYLNRDVKPEGPPPELTPKEKRRNWWYYHWKIVAVVCIIVLAGVSMLLHNLGITEPISGAGRRCLRGRKSDGNPYPVCFL